MSKDPNGKASGLRARVEKVIAGGEKVAASAPVRKIVALGESTPIRWTVVAALLIGVWSLRSMLSGIEVNQTRIEGKVDKVIEQCVVHVADQEKKHDALEQFQTDQSTRLTRLETMHGIGMQGVKTQP